MDEQLTVRDCIYLVYFAKYGVPTTRWELHDAAARAYAAASVPDVYNQSFTI